MKKPLNIVVWALAIAGIVFVITTDGSKLNESITVAIELPDDQPDVYLTNMELTQIDDAGQPTMYTTADSFAVYESRGESRLTNPNVVLTRDGEQTWQVTSKFATLFDNNNITFYNNVLAIQLNSDPALTLTSDKITVLDNATALKTDQPVTITKGRQMVNAVGMVGELTSAETYLELLSQVRFKYDPS